MTALGRALEDPGHFGQQIGAARGQLPELGYRGAVSLADKARQRKAGKR
jgi:hypothetical protein